MKRSRPQADQHVSQLRRINLEKVGLARPHPGVACAPLPRDKEAAWAAFLADLEALPAEFKVLGINDYVFVDGYARVLEERRRGRLANIDLVLPVVELRVDKFGGVLEKTDEGYAPSAWSRVNLHVIFDEVDPQMIRDQFLSAITPRYTLVAGSSQNQWGGGVITRDSLTD